MFLTEIQAKIEWCPFSRTGLLAGPGGVSVNRSVDIRGGPYDVTETTRCIGADCMAWRWSHADIDQENGQLVSTWPEIAKFHPKDRKLVRYGFCGLAGNIER